MRITGLLLSVAILTLHPMLNAHAQDEADSDAINIFDSINIELIDLQELGDRIRDRLVGEEVQLSLDDCIAMALANNSDIEIVEYERLLADSDYESARGDFDPLLSGSITHIDDSSPASPLQAQFGGFSGNVDNQLTDYQLQVGGKFTRWGTQYNVAYNLDTQSGTFTTNPLTGEEIDVYTGGITTTITQPILRGRGTNLNRIRITSTENGRHISEAQIKTTALTTIGETIKAYWNLVGAIDNLAVRQQSLDNAIRLVEINETSLRIGTLAAIEVLQAKAGAATRQSELITARTTILDAEDILKNFIHLTDNSVFSSKSITPTTGPGKVGFDWDLEKSMTTALKNRPELTNAQLQIENAKLDSQRTGNDLLPQLDGSVSYGQNARTLHHSDVYDGIRDKDGRSWNVGITGSIPILNRTAKGAHNRARQFEQQQERRLAKAQQDIMLDVRTAIRGIVTSELLVETNRQARILQEANVAAEERRLSLGVTTSQIVLDRQEDLTLAQTEELRSIVDYEKALVQLQMAEGVLLDNLNIELE